MRIEKFDFLRRKLLTICSSAMISALSMSLSSIALAQTDTSAEASFPNKPIRVIVPSPPGAHRIL